MDEREVVRFFLDKGYQLAEGALSLVSSDPEQIISELGKLKPRPFIVTEDHVKKIFEKSEKPKEFEARIVKEFHPQKESIKVEDYVEHFASRYEKLKTILSQHASLEKLISINKITPDTREFSIIGLIREKKDNSLLVEDPTGETEIFFNDLMKQRLEEIALDDVIGIRCRKIQDRLFAGSVIYPDIPLSKKVQKTKGEGKIIVIYNPSENRFLKLIESTGDLTRVFCFWDGKPEPWKSKFNFIHVSQYEVDQEFGQHISNPVLMQIDSIKILILPKHFFLEAKPETLLYILKKRHISPTFDPRIHVKSDELVLEDIPDIIVSNLNESFYKNYKGTTIISNSDSNRVYLIDLKTREVTERDV